MKFLNFEMEKCVANKQIGIRFKFIYWSTMLNVITYNINLVVYQNNDCRIILCLYISLLCFGNMHQIQSLYMPYPYILGINVIKA